MYVCAQNGREEIRVLGGLGASGGGDGAGADKGGVVDQARALQQRCCEHFLGRGLVMANGEAWARQRRTLAPAFHLERLKVLTMSYL